MQKLSFTIENWDEFRNELTRILRDELNSQVKQVTPENDEFITRKEAAKILGISLPTLGKWTKEGRVPAFRISSRVRYKRHDVIDSLNAVKAVKP